MRGLILGVWFTIHYIAGIRERNIVLQETRTGLCANHVEWESVRQMFKTFVRKASRKRVAELV